MAEIVSIPLESNCTLSQLISLEFVFGNNVDEHYIKAYLPKGWTKTVCDQGVNTQIFDNLGRLRISISIPIDDKTSPNMHLHRRFRSNIEYIEKSNQGEYTYQAVAEFIKKSEWTPTWRSDAVILEDDDEDGFDKLKKSADDWLTDRYSDWKDPLAYWDYK